MPQTRGFIRLGKRVTALEAKLPPQNPTGNYTDAEQDDIRAYRLLVHAECEHYFEQVGLKIVAKAFVKYQATQRPSKVLNSLRQSFCGERLPVQEAGDAFEKAVNSYRKRVKGNHGVREPNLCKLLLPLGIGEAVLDPAWLAVMNSFGQARGQVAHTSAFGQQILDPVTEKAKVALVVAGIQLVDQVLQRIRTT